MPMVGTLHYRVQAGRNTAVQQPLRCGASLTRASVLAEGCRVLLYQVINLSEKFLKGFSTPVLAL